MTVRDNAKNPRDYWNALASSSGQAAAIDPRDRRGSKNAYISLVRNHATLSALEPVRGPGTLLDFGTGTGTFLTHIRALRPDLDAVGTDVSLVMLRYARERDPALTGSVFLYDGRRLPLRDGSIDVITTAGVLLYFRQEEEIAAICREFSRVLRPGGRVIAIEQIRRRTRQDPANMKVQRAPAELVRAFAGSGLACREWRQIRRGRFPLLYAIRYGVLPARLHRRIATLEARLWRGAPLPFLDYADAAFTFEKSDGSSA